MTKETKKAKKKTIECPCCGDPKKREPLYWSKAGKTRQLCDEHREKAKRARRLMRIDRESRRAVKPRPKPRVCVYCRAELPDSVPKGVTTHEGGCREMVKPHDFDRPRWHKVVYGGHRERW